MSIVYKEGNVFDSGIKAIAIAVNTAGAMGKGQALECRQRFPNVEAIYRIMCNNKTIKLGEITVVEDQGTKLVLFPTKAHWKYPSKYEWVKDGLLNLRSIYKEMNIDEIALIPLGCGLGGLDKNRVRLLIEKIFKNEDLNIVCYNFD